MSALISSSANSVLDCQTLYETRPFVSVSNVSIISGAHKEKEHLTRASNCVEELLSKWFDQISPYMVVGKDLNIITSTYNDIQSNVCLLWVCQLVPHYYTT